MQQVPLLAFFDAKQSRRIKVIQQLLTGRRTISTLFWGMRYGLLSCFKTFAQLPKEFQATSLQSSLSNHQLIDDCNQMYHLSPQAAASSMTDYYHLNFGFDSNLNYNVERFAQRFYIANQIISEFSYHNQHYYPLNVSYQEARFVKKWFHEYKDDDLVGTWQRFLTTFLQSQPADDLAWQLISGLVGHQTPGLTIDQQARLLSMPVVMINLRQRLLLNHLINTFGQSDVPMLRTLLYGLEESAVSRSAQQTLREFQEGASLAAIAHRRRLRPSTVNEHILENAILGSLKDVPMDTFIPHAHLEQLERLFHGNVDDWQFTKVRDSNLSVSFFEFRLFQIMRGQSDGQP